ncbi:MAG: complex I NDUFA9 subunit family protein [Chloroflexota bacterium]
MILIAGGSGYVGSVVVPDLVRAGHQVRVLSRGTRSAGLPAGVETARGDVTTGEGLNEALDGCDSVLNLVAIIVEKGRQTFERVNAQGSRNLVAEAQRHQGITRYLHLSAIGARPDPRFGYLSSKYAGERAVVESGLPYTVFRPSIMFGNGRGVHFISILAGLVRANPVVPVPGSGKARFQPVWLGDVSAAIAASIANEQARDRVLEIAGPDQLTYDDMVDQVARAMGKPRPKVHIPLGLMKPVVALMEQVLPNPPVTNDQLRSLAIDNITADNALVTFFHRQPRPLAEGLDYV